ncbi:unnamed protein product, partial [Lampetra planeri]
RALAPLQAKGLKVLPYLDDWLVCTPSRAQVTRDTARLLDHVSRLGLTVNTRKSCRVQSLRAVWLPGDRNHVADLDLFTDHTPRCVDCLFLLDGGGRSSGTGCVESRVASLPALCLSSDTDDPPDSAPGPAPRPPASPGHPVLAEEALVSSAAEGSAAARHGASQTGGTSCHSSAVASGTPTPVVSNCGSGRCRARSTTERLYCSSETHNLACARALHTPAIHEQVENILYLVHRKGGRSDPSARSPPSWTFSNLSWRTVGHTPPSECMWQLFLRLVTSFLKGALRSRPSVPPRVPPWDLTLGTWEPCLPLHLSPWTQVDVKWRDDIER